METNHQPRRTEGVRVRGRSARVVRDVLRATLQELGRVGYAALRVEDVAVLSGVNKTTIYRRWPTKLVLVGAALRTVTGEYVMPDTGSLRNDLFVSLRQSFLVTSPAVARGLVRVLQAERGNPELDELTRGLREESHTARAQILERAIQRGELPETTDVDLVAATLLSATFSRVINHGEELNEDFMRSVVDLIVTGTEAGGAAKKKG